MRDKILKKYIEKINFNIIHREKIIIFKILYLINRDDGINL